MQGLNRFENSNGIRTLFSGSDDLGCIRKSRCLIGFCNSLSRATRSAFRLLGSQLGSQAAYLQNRAQHRAGDTRRRYVEALRAAHNHDIGPLRLLPAPKREQRRPCSSLHAQSRDEDDVISAARSNPISPWQVGARYRKTPLSALFASRMSRSKLRTGVDSSVSSRVIRYTAPANAGSATRNSLNAPLAISRR